MSDEAVDGGGLVTEKLVKNWEWAEAMLGRGEMLQRLKWTEDNNIRAIQNVIVGPQYPTTLLASDAYGRIFSYTQTEEDKAAEDWVTL